MCKSCTWLKSMSIKDSSIVTNVSYITKTIQLFKMPVSLKNLYWRNDFLEKYNLQNMTHEWENLEHSMLF